MVKASAKTKLAAALALMVALAGNAYGSTIVRTFNVWNVNNVSGNYGSVTVDDSVTGSIKFTVDANDSFFTGAAAGKDHVPTLTWDKFFFNVDSGVTLNLSNFDFTGMPSDRKWSVASDSGSGNVSSFGIFTDNATYQGATIENDPLVFYYRSGSSTLSASDFVLANPDGYYFTGHLRNIAEPSDIGQTSVFLASTDTPPVPEPGTMVLFAAGCLGLAIYGKRRRN